MENTSEKKESQTADIAKIASLCKRRGFLFQSSEIYGGLRNVWDYGPLGAELKNNVKRAWWKNLVYERDNIEGLDAAILMARDVWVASGHAENFEDMLVDCKSCKKRFRVDHLNTDKCPDCGGEFTDTRKFNLMFKTYIGAVQDNKESEIFLRPETAQGIFVNFNNVLNSSRKKIPFGIAQIGKSFRNEVTAGNLIFRCREFEQMEMEYFVFPDKSEESYKFWVKERLDWYKQMGIRENNLRLREHSKDELAHYASACCDIEYQFPFGWSELEGIANRGDFDLKTHASFSKQDLSFYDEASKQKVVPHVIEPSGGVDRAFLAFLIDAYREEQVRKDKRVVLGFSKELAPIKTAVLPLLRNRPQIVETAKNITKDLRKDRRTVYDDTASIGKLYRRQDEIGTVYCVTVDVDSLEDKKVTVRDRDTMLQERIPVDGIKTYLRDKFDI